MSDRWMTVADAAVRLGVDRRTVRRYITRDGVREIAGRVRESDVVDAERKARQRASAGRPKSKNEPIRSEGEER